MNEFLYKIDKIAKNRRWVSYDVDFMTIYVYAANLLIRLNSNNLYFLYEYGQIEKTSRVIVESSTNVIEFSQDFKPKSLDYFTDYLSVKYQGEFIPFYLTFLKATPYDKRN